MLPQIVPALRNNAYRRPLTLSYRDPYSWDLPTLSAMLSAFFSASGTTSLPPLEEYTTLPDKVVCPLAYAAHSSFHRIVIVGENKIGVVFRLVLRGLNGLE